MQSIRQTNEKNRIVVYESITVVLQEYYWWFARVLLVVCESITGGLREYYWLFARVLLVVARVLLVVCESITGHFQNQMTNLILLCVLMRWMYFISD